MTTQDWSLGCFLETAGVKAPIMVLSTNIMPNLVDENVYNARKAARITVTRPAGVDDMRPPVTPEPTKLVYQLLRRVPHHDEEGNTLESRACADIVMLPIHSCNHYALLIAAGKALYWMDSLVSHAAAFVFGEDTSMLHSSRYQCLAVCPC